MKDSRAIKIRITSLASIIFKDLGFSRKVCWYIRRRIANEGVAFVTRVLPTVSKHMLSCIEMGQWCPIPFEELKISPLPVTGPERYTAIFADELKSIFTDDQDAPLNLWRIRQAAEYLYKLALPFSVQQLDLAAEKFLTTDLSVSYDHEFAEQVRVSAERLFSTTQKLILDDVVKAARNGPGTYSGYQSCAFSNSLQEQKDILDGVVPARLNAFASAFRCRRTSLNHFTVHNEWKLQTFSNLIKHPNFWLRWSLMGSPSLMLVPTQITRSLKTPLRSFSYWMQGKLRWYTSEKNRKSRRTLEKSRRSQSEIYRALRSNDESTSEVLFVPKDSRGPRTIVREPYFNLRLQMGLHDLIRDSFAHDTRGRIQFNRRTFVPLRMNHLFTDGSVQSTSKTQVIALALELSPESSAISLQSKVRLSISARDLRVYLGKMLRYLCVSCPVWGVVLPSLLWPPSYIQPSTLEHRCPAVTESEI
jgi:hypothetical protein